MAESKGLPMTAKWDPDRSNEKKPNSTPWPGNLSFPGGRLHQADWTGLCKAP